MVVVDDLSIISPSGETFDLNDDFALPKGSKFYSDLNAPEGAPSRAERMARAQQQRQREQQTVQAQPRQQTQQAQRNAAAPAPEPLPAESAEVVEMDVRTSCVWIRLPAIAVCGRGPSPDAQVSPCVRRIPRALLCSTMGATIRQRLPTGHGTRSCPCIPICWSRSRASGETGPQRV